MIEKMWNVFEKFGIGKVNFDNPVVENEYIKKRVEMIKIYLEQKNYEKAEEIIKTHIFPIYRFEITDEGKFQKMTMESEIFNELPGSIYPYIMIDMGFDEKSGMNIGFRKSLFSLKGEKKTKLELWCEEQDAKYKMEKMFELEKANKKKELEMLKKAIQVFSSEDSKKIKKHIINQVVKEMVKEKTKEGANEGRRVIG